MGEDKKKHLPREANIIKMMPIDGHSIRFLYTAIGLAEDMLKEIYCADCIQWTKDCLLINLQEFQIAEAEMEAYEIVNAPSTRTRQ